MVEGSRDKNVFTFLVTSETSPGNSIDFNSKAFLFHKCKLKYYRLFDRQRPSVRLIVNLSHENYLDPDPDWSCEDEKITPDVYRLRAKPTELFGESSNMSANRQLIGLTEVASDVLLPKSIGK